MKKYLSIILALVIIITFGIIAIPAAAFNASDWAKPELEKAQNYGLIPDALKNADLTKPITRAEFAAVAVKLYENLSGKKAAAAEPNPFTDTRDMEVLKAYNIGLTAGTSATTFSPENPLTREQAATMLTRSLKASYIPGWTLADDGEYTLNFTQSAKFADDGRIADWAKASVYYLVANSILQGTGGNNFSPSASATREQALIIAARIVDNLKGKLLDYSGGTTQPSGNIDSALVGEWYNVAIPYYWINSWTSEAVWSVANGVYRFNENGTFEYQFYRTGWMPKYTGKYSVSGEKIYFTEVTGQEINSSGAVRNMEFNLRNQWEVTMDYSFGTDDEGEYLNLYHLQNHRENGINAESDGRKYRKVV